MDPRTDWSPQSIGILIVGVLLVVALYSLFIWLKAKE